MTKVPSDLNNDIASAISGDLATAGSTVFTSMDSVRRAWDYRKTTLDEVRRQTIERRERAVMGAVALGIPNTRHEEWKYTSLRPLLDGRFDLVAGFRRPRIQVTSDVVELVNSRLAPGAIPVVFVDGRLDLSWPGSEDLDPDFFRTLSEAELHEDSSWWDEWQTAPGMGQLFSGIAAGIAHEGVVICLNRKQELRRPLHIVHLATTADCEAARLNRVVISLPEMARARVYEEFISIHGGSFHQDVAVWSNVLTQLKLGPGADCGYYRILASPASFHTGSVSAVLEKDSRLETFSLTAGARWARVNIDIEFRAQGAECLLDGLYLARDREHVDHHTTVDHRVGLCQSRQLYKGILADQGRAVFNGKVFIRKDAQKTEAYQTNKNLLLSADAEVDTKPQLEIDADDVKASHGAAIGSIDPAELFYLRSRCIGHAEAVAMLCRGFADDVVTRVNDDVARKVLLSRVNEWFKRRVLAGEVVL